MASRVNDRREEAEDESRRHARLVRQQEPIFSNFMNSIKVTGDGGLDAQLTRATIKTKEGIITSDQPSTVLMGAGKITSNQLTIRQKTKEYTFLDTVRTHMKPKEPGARNKRAERSQVPSLRQARRARRRRLEPARHRRRRKDRTVFRQCRRDASRRNPQVAAAYA